ncbi:Abhydrolase domain-containing protein mpaH [Psilocybe cubensis]|uniref:AB hydrolase-1 domain-containing protein n=2 Tax=Psilocybe cubensis TaxID=181762 RepID=A0A8H8CEX5_PSICU|nr:Abhydrolase domain-containing protein mpaH [Psilocybe cubensis]KAH9483336.1 Abhydrolase domain-containing protein mpaH [Psilocybe cubensis]
MTLEIERYTLSTLTYGVPLTCPMKRYMRKIDLKTPIPEGPGVILLLAHGAGFFKETWEPTIEDLFELDKGMVVHEAWALDCQNHGEGCTLNEDVLSRKPGILTIWDYADAFSALYRSGLLDPMRQGHKIFICGHSAGSVAVALSTSFFNPPSSIPFAGVILVDPPMWGTEKEGQFSDMYKMVETMTPIRRDTWKSHDAAVKSIKGSLPFAMWDERVLDTYIKYGLRPLPTAFYPDKQSGVTLTTHRQEENIAFTGYQFIRDAVNQLNIICRHVPVHLIYGDRNDMFERDIQDSLINPQEGRTFASVARIEGAGHLVVQEAPSALAAALLAAVVTKDRTLSSKL